MTGMTGGEPLLIYDKALRIMRPVVYGDIVILLRSARVWTPLMIEELRAEGIPAYGDQNKGYFQATEVEIALSLLQIVDNPRQDIPLAGVLRSPVVNLREEELAKVRLCSRGTFYDALVAASEAGEALRDNPPDLFWDAALLAGQDAGTGDTAGETAAASELTPSSANEGVQEGITDGTDASAALRDIPITLQRKLKSFRDRLENWRNAARQGSLSELIWRIYRESGYLEWVGGLPGGFQRQNNLKALYDRAVQFENETSARGLFRFLVFISRLRENGGDLGLPEEAARRPGASEL